MFYIRLYVFPEIFMHFETIFWDKERGKKKEMSQGNAITAASPGR